MDLRIRITVRSTQTVSEASGDTPDEWLHAAVIGVWNRIWTYISDVVKLSKRSCTRNLLQNERRNTNVMLPIFFLCSTLQVHNQ